MTAPQYNAGPWSPAEDRELRSRAAAGESATAIGILLKRRAWSVRSRASILKIKLARSRPGLKAKGK
jgi:hypothetical protein